jgi:hypothetical protein
MIKNALLGCSFLLTVTLCKAQELQARITVNASNISSQTDRRIFQTLQAALVNFLNNRKWTRENFEVNEKINCNFLLNITQAENNIFKATLTVQAARPVYNSSYETPLLNFIDESVSFRYIEHQSLEFNENRVSGTDPISSNLTAVLAFYVNIILGLDYDSFAMRGGDPYFQRAQNIVNNAPDGREILGWRAFDGQRNRYWLIENLTNSRYTLIHDAIYSYYRMGMDNMYENEASARVAIMNTLSLLDNLNAQSPNLMIVQLFFLGKSNEFIRIFKKAPMDEKVRTRELLSKLDVSNVNAYKQELK